MGLKKCCVGGCSATSDTHRLFRFPKNDKLRDSWMSFVLPTNPQLIGLTKDQLIDRCVCEKHFDKQQFDEEGKRLRYSYPCLITDDEIKRGEPLPTPGTVHNAVSDHNYCKEQDDEEDLSGNLVILTTADKNFHGHPTCSHSEAHTSVTEMREGVLAQPLCSFHKQIEELSEDLADNVVNKPLPTVTVTTNDKKSTIQDHSRSSIKKLGSKKRKFVKQVTDIATKSLGQSATERISQAIDYGRNEQIFKNFEYLNRQAKAFILLQLKLCRKNKMARRFTLEEKLIALTLMKQSPKAYKLLQVMFALPEKRTLNRLSEKMVIEPGLTPAIFKYIENKTKTWDDKKKLCTIVFDEIALTSHLDFNEKTDEIRGFVDIGERSLKFCDHALVFMLRGIHSSWRQSVAYYLCEGTTSAAALQNILKQVVSKVALTGLIPLGLVCDQGSTFRTAIKKFKEDTIRMRNIQNIKDDGSVNIAGHDLSIFFDPPHLLKGIRNNFVTKDIIWEGRTGCWKDIQFIYDIDSKLGHTRALPKLTANHVDPAKIRKMKVSVAAQVFSARTAAMLKYTNELNKRTGFGERTTMDTTAEIIEFFDKLFDSVNCNPGGATIGKLRKAVKVDSPHHAFWTQAIRILKSLKYLDKDSKIAIQSGKPRLVRVPSLEGWITTLESFIRISKLLFEKYGVDHYYPRLINQDPLENFFGRIRAINYRNINPDANTFLYAFKSLVLSNFLGPHSKFANCEVDDGETLIDLNILFDEKNDENEPQNVCGSFTSTISQERASGSNIIPSPISRDEVILEKIKVQTSAYTAGYLCRKITKAVNCKQCSKTYLSRDTENIHTYIKYREYKLLKNNNLSYPNTNFLVLYRDASNFIHNYLNINCYKKNISKNLIIELKKKLKFSWLGCANSNHANLIENVFLKNVIKLQVHNWCNIINKILKGQIEEKYVSKMGVPQTMALKKYKTMRVRRKTLNK